MSADSQPRSPFRSALLLIALWSIPALFSTLERYVFMSLAGSHPVLWQVALTEGAGWYVWAAMTPLIFALSRRMPLRWPARWPTVSTHIAVCLMGALAHAVVYTMAGRVAGTTTVAAGFPVLVARAALGWFPVSVLAYVGLVSGGHWLASARRERERERRTAALEAQLARAQLQALRMQLHPHFLFNTLNTISVLVRERQNATAVRLLAQLGDVLRQVLRSASTHEVRLGDELDFIRQYLDIEQVRFADRLRVIWRIDPAALEAAVPNLVLQPLVENALRHGIARRPDAGRLEIGARREGDRLVLWVRDDGSGLVAATEPGEGVGLSNVRARLAALYGADAELRLEPIAADEGGGVRAVIALPWRAGVSAPAASPLSSGAETTDVEELHV